MKKISRDKYLAAFALYSLATEYQRKVDEAETAMNKIFSEDNGSHLSDLIYTYGATPSEDAFNEALERMGFEVDQSNNSPDKSGV